MKTQKQPTYLKPGDPDSFKDMEIKPNPGDRRAGYALENIKSFMNSKDGEALKNIRIQQKMLINALEEVDDYGFCPKCQGYGGWNLKVDCYGGRYKGEIVPELRHFQSSCNQCWGYGWVKKGSLSAKCIHKWVHSRAGKWNCTHYEKCSECGTEVFIDSGD